MATIALMTQSSCDLISKIEF